MTSFPTPRNSTPQIIRVECLIQSLPDFSVNTSTCKCSVEVEQGYASCSAINFPLHTHGLLPKLSLIQGLGIKIASRLALSGPQRAAGFLHQELFPASEGPLKGGPG